MIGLCLAAKKDRNGSPMGNDLQDLRARLRNFADARDWQQFHSPKNLACALSVEAAELLEHFQWMREDESRKLTPEKLSAVEMEMADVLCYLVQMADQLGVDLAAATARKIDLNEKRYPIDLAKGKSTKHNEL